MWRARTCHLVKCAQLQHDSWFATRNASYISHIDLPSTTKPPKAALLIDAPRRAYGRPIV